MTIYEVVLEGAINSQPMLSVLHYDVTGSTDFQALSDAFAIQIVAELRDLIVPNARWDGIRVREDIPGGVGVFYPFTGGSIIGTTTVTDCWALIAANIRKNAPGGQRPAQGRIYQGGIPADKVTAGGNIEAAYALDLAAAWETMRSMTFAGSGQADMVIKASNPAAPNTVPYNPVASLTTLLRPATQGRRNYGT